MAAATRKRAGKQREARMGLHPNAKAITMRGMRACATANAVVLGLAAAAFGFTACAGGSTPPENPTPTGPTASAVATTTTAPILPPPQKAAPKTPADCKELTSDITNDPPANGV